MSAPARGGRGAHGRLSYALEGRRPRGCARFSCVPAKVPAPVENLNAFTRSDPYKAESD